MALTYKTDQITLNAANTDFTILTATATTTLVKNITWIHDDHNTNVILSLTKSGGTKTQIGSFAATADTPKKIWTDILPLEANDVLHLQSDHISSSDVGYCIISYVEDTTSVAGQSIGVHTDVDITGITNGQILKWNSTDTEFQPGDEAGGLTDTDDLTEGSTNLYYTNARADARIAAANVTDLSDVTSAGSGQIITAAERTKLTGIETGATADQTDAEIKTAYENNADTNAFTDAEQTKLSGIATGATANSTDTELLKRVNHTGTQTASTISDFDTEVSNNTSVAANTAKTSFPGFGTTAGTALEGDTALLQLGTTSSTALAGDTAVVLSINGETPDQDGDVNINTDLSGDTTPQLGGDLDTNGKNIIYAKTSTTDHEHNGDIIKYGAGSTTQGELCYLQANGEWAAADANAASSAGGVLLAIALGTDPDVDGMLLRGVYTLDHDPGTQGDELYISTTAGDITNDVSTYGTGDIVRVVGYALDSSAGQIWFNPSPDFIELA